MEQIGVFLTEYSSWIFAGLYGLTVILLFVTLRRIKQMQRSIREMAGNVRYIADKTADLHGQRLAEQRSMQQNQVQEAVRERPEELIDAVLEEVFP